MFTYLTTCTKNARLLLAAVSVDCLLQAWMNEKFSPELLEHKTHIVECILEQIKEMVCYM